MERRTARRTSVLQDLSAPHFEQRTRSVLPPVKRRRMVEMLFHALVRRGAVRTVRSFYCRPEKTRTRSAKIFSLPGTDEPRLARMKFLGAGVIRRGMRDQIGILLRDPFRDRVSRIGQRGRYFRIGRLRALRAPLVGHHVFDKSRAGTARSWRRRAGGSLRVLEQLEREGPHRRMSRFRQSGGVVAQKGLPTVVGR
jgi:hypothetical protein